MFIRKEYIAKCCREYLNADGYRRECEHEERAETPERAAEMMWNYWFRAHYEEAEKEFREWKERNAKLLKDGVDSHGK